MTVRHHTARTTTRTAVLVPAALAAALAGSLALAAPGNASTSTPTTTVCVGAGGGVTLATRPTPSLCPRGTTGVQVPTVMAPRPGVGIGAVAWRVDGAVTVTASTTGTLVKKVTRKVATVRHDGLTVQATCTSAGPGRPVTASLTVTTPSTSPTVPITTPPPPAASSNRASSTGSVTALVTKTTGATATLGNRSVAHGVHLVHLPVIVYPTPLVLASPAGDRHVREAQLDAALPGLTATSVLRATLTEQARTGDCTVRAQLVRVS